MPGNKKPEKKAQQQEPPAEQSPEDQVAPLAAPAPAKEDRLAALEKANMELEGRLQKLERNCRASHGMR